MSQFKMISKQQFQDVACEFLGNEQEEIFMTSEQLGQALGYLNPRNSISNLVRRHTYLKSREFTGVINLVTPSGTQQTRVFTEDGIYEVTFLANTERALQFRSWVRKILKELRKQSMNGSTHETEILPHLQQELHQIQEAIQESDIKVNHLTEQVNQQMTIDYGKQMKIQFVIRKRVIQLLGGKTTLAYSKLRAKYFAAIYRDIKKRMGVSSYRDIRIKDYEAALTFIENW